MQHEIISNLLAFLSRFLNYTLHLVRYHHAVQGGCDLEHNDAILVKDILLSTLRPPSNSGSCDDVVSVHLGTYF